MKYNYSGIALVAGVVAGQCFAASGVTAQTANSVVLGSCNIVQQNLAVAKGSTVINEVDCVPPSLEDSFSLRYVWLDATTSSLLIAGYFDSSLKPLIGSMQSVARNSVFHRLEDIVHRFGTPISDTSGTVLSKDVEYSLQGSRSEISVSNRGDRLPLDVIKKLKLYDGEQTILLPDTSALQTLIGSQTWPTGYKITYSDEFGTLDRSKTKQDIENAALMCVLLYKSLSKETLVNYWNDMDLLETLIEKKQLRQEEVVNASVNVSEDFRVAALQNQAIAAMPYFGEKNWPEDFLLGFGNAYTEGCGTGYNVGFYALPRKLFTLVAVIEAKASTIEIQGMSFDVDATEGLHVLSKGDKTETAPPGSIVLQKGETVLVPLRIELRYDLDQTPVATLVDAQGPRKLYTKITSLPNTTFQFRSSELSSIAAQPPVRTIFIKAKSAFRPPETMQVTQSYVFGPGYNLKDITLKGKAIAVRSAPASALVFVGDTGLGSCPFLFVDGEADKYVKIGRVLVGASNAGLAREEIVQLPSGTHYFYVSEQEPEITRLERVSVKGGTNSEEVILAENIEVRPGWSRRFEIPGPLRGNTQLTIRGYYTQLELRDANAN